MEVEIFFVSICGQLSQMNPPNEKGSVRSTAEMDSKLMALCGCLVVKDGTQTHQLIDPKGQGLTQKKKPRCKV